MSRKKSLRDAIAYDIKAGMTYEEVHKKYNVSHSLIRKKTEEAVRERLILQAELNRFLDTQRQCVDSGPDVDQHVEVATDRTFEHGSNQQASASTRSSESVNIYFTADTHFGENYNWKIKKRPFSSAQEMNKALIQNWNKIVTDRDTVYHLGDVGNSLGLSSILQRLHGRKILIKGNADPLPLPVRGLYWDEVAEESMIIDVEGQKIWLAHRPHKRWPGQNRGTWHLHGHCHGLDSTKPGRLDVGVDCWDFRPVSFAEIRERMSLLQGNSHK
jgi:calcineurin-like phosphoesterase family protein